jgi:hypothetical protein
MEYFNPVRTLKELHTWLLALVVLSFFSTGCDKFEGDQTVPSYLYVDSIGFFSDNDVQGSSNQKIVDVWVYVDDDIIGGFEMPATIPVLAEGAHKLEIRAGILLNGISETRAPNPCWKPVVFESFNFTPDSITKTSGTSSYFENAEFVWMENFEDASLAIKKSNNSDTGIVRTQPANSPDAFTEDFSLFSGISFLDKDRNYVQLVSDDGNNQGFVFDRGDFIFLELNYKNDVPMVVGVYIKLMDNTIEERPFLIISPSNVWNKIYVNFTPMVNETVDAVSYTIYIEADLPAGTDHAQITLDNIKLVTRPNL